MRRAVALANTYQVVIKETVHFHSAEVSARISGDGARSPAAAQTRSNVWSGLFKPGSAHWFHSTARYARLRHLVATLTRKGWECATESTRSIDGSLVLQPFPQFIERPVNLGPAEIGGVPVWHIRANVVVAEPPGVFDYAHLFGDKSPRTPADLYVTRSTSLLVRETVNQPGTKGMPAEHLVATFTHYGQRASFSLPRVCSASG